jgi:hypothetical protein
MAKLDILKLYKKEDCYILFLYQIVEKTLKKTIEVIIYVAFFMIPILITRTILQCLFLKDLFALLSVDVNYTLF